MPDRDFVDSLFVAGIDLLRCPQNRRERLLRQIMIFPQIPQVFGIMLHLKSPRHEYTTHQKCYIDFTLYLVYNISIIFR